MFQGQPQAHLQHGQSAIVRFGRPDSGGLQYNKWLRAAVIHPPLPPTPPAAGEGAFAVVESCNYTSVDGGKPLLVAVKKLKPHVLSSPDDLEAFFKEVSLVSEGKSDIQSIGLNLR